MVTLYPFLNIVARSFSTEEEILAGRVNIVPRGFDLTTYRLVMSDDLFWTNYRNTVVYTVTATIISIVLTTCYAYVLSKKHLRGRGLLIGIAVFTMFFSGGLIPNYVLVSGLGLRNTIWAVVLPNAINVFNLLVMKRSSRACRPSWRSRPRSTGSARTARCCGSCCRCPRPSSPPWCCSTRSPTGTRGSPRSSTWTGPSCSRSPSTCGT